MMVSTIDRFRARVCDAILFQTFHSFNSLHVDARVAVAGFINTRVVRRDKETKLVRSIVRSPEETNGVIDDADGFGVVR